MAETVFYNGWRGGEHIVMSRDHATEARRLGIEKMAERCVQGRAILIDLHALVGDAKADIGFDGLEEAMKAQGAVVEPGDMVCFHTGFGRKIMEMNRQPNDHTLNHSCAALDGRDPRLQQWIIDSGVAALISDNVAVERYPNKSGSGRRPLVPLHELCLFKLGIHSGRAVVAQRLGRLHARCGAHPLPSDRAAASAARGGRLPGDPGGDSVALWVRLAFEGIVW